MPFAQQTKHKLILTRFSSASNQINVSWLSENRLMAKIPSEVTINQQIKHAIYLEEL